MSEKLTVFVREPFIFGRPKLAIFIVSAKDVFYRIVSHVHDTRKSIQLTYNGR